jgi:hypothetical protein
MLNHRDERIAMMRFFIEVHQIQRQQIGSGDMTAMSIAWIVALGHLEGRLFNASKISSYLSIPRTTVIRKLRWLVEKGAIKQKGNEYSLSSKSEFMPDEQYAMVAMAIHHLSEKVPLPKMDNVHSGHTEPEQPREAQG